MGVAWYSWASEAAGGGGAQGVGSSTPGQCSAPPSRRLNVLRSEWSWLCKRNPAGREGPDGVRGERRGEGRAVAAGVLSHFCFCSLVELMRRLGSMKVSLCMMSGNGYLLGGMLKHFHLWHLGPTPLASPTQGNRDNKFNVTEPRDFFF